MAVAGAIHINISSKRPALFKKNTEGERGALGFRGWNREIRSYKNHGKCPTHVLLCVAGSNLVSRLSKFDVKGRFRDTASDIDFAGVIQLSAARTSALDAAGAHSKPHQSRQRPPNEVHLCSGRKGTPWGSTRQPRTCVASRGRNIRKPHEIHTQLMMKLIRTIYYYFC